MTGEQIDNGTGADEEKVLIGVYPSDVKALTELGTINESLIEEEASPAVIVDVTEKRPIIRRLATMISGRTMAKGEGLNRGNVEAVKIEVTPQEAQLLQRSRRLGAKATQNT